MKKLTLVIASVFTLAALVLAPSVTFAASCGVKNKYDATGKVIGTEPIKTSIDYGCSGKGDGITQIFLVAVNFLAIGVGIAVVGGIVFGGIRYASANGNASQAQQGITVIANAVIGLMLFLFMYAIINFLVPGGLLN